MQFVGYNFTIITDTILFDEELDPEKVFESMGIEDNTICIIENIDGQLVIRTMYDDEDYDPDPEEVDYKPSSNIFKLVV
tara:strand:- start:5991 stop:6227 length:237 start_codon:yes stop_codon:yes gene_type:complete